MNIGSALHWMIQKEIKRCFNDEEHIKWFLLIFSMAQETWKMHVYTMYVRSMNVLGHLCESEYKIEICSTTFYIIYIAIELSANSINLANTLHFRCFIIINSIIILLLLSFILFESKSPSFHFTSHEHGSWDNKYICMNTFYTLHCIHLYWSNIKSERKMLHFAHLKDEMKLIYYRTNFMRCWPLSALNDTFILSFVCVCMRTLI